MNSIALMGAEHTPAACGCVYYRDSLVTLSADGLNWTCEHTDYTAARWRGFGFGDYWGVPGHHVFLGADLTARNTWLARFSAEGEA